MNEEIENLIFDLEDLKICEEIAKNHIIGKQEDHEQLNKKIMEKLAQLDMKLKLIL